MAFFPPRPFHTPRGDVVTIRTAHPDDADAMIAYMQPRIRDDEFYILLPEEFDEIKQKEPQWIQDHMDSPGQLILVADTPGGIVGMTNFENYPRKRVAHSGVFGISVAPPWRRLGIGKTLLETLIQWATQSPEIEKISLGVFAANHGAIRLYRKLGFVDEGRRPNHLKLGPGQYADEILMYRFVKPLPPAQPCAV